MMQRNDSQLDPVEQASLESFPASDAPSWVGGREKHQIAARASNDAKPQNDAKQPQVVTPEQAQRSPEKETFVASEVMVPHTHVHRLTRQFLEPAQDILVLAIGLALFGIMIRSLGWLILQIFKPTLNFREVMAEVLFMLVMVEVVRLVISYLKEHRVAVDFMVELGIVATLREILLRGVTDLPWQQVSALTVFVLALGALLRFGDLRSPHGSDLEQPVSQSGVKGVSG
jgi:uncharacterized membrane protein (DUF373 family)